MFTLVTSKKHINASKNKNPLCLENKLLKYILILLYIPFTFSISAWPFPCYFHTKTQCTILVHTIRATWQPGLNFLLLTARKNPVCHCVNRQSARAFGVVCIGLYRIEMSYGPLIYYFVSSKQYTARRLERINTAVWADFWGRYTNVLQN